MALRQVAANRTTLSVLSGTAGAFTNTPTTGIGVSGDRARTILINNPNTTAMQLGIGEDVGTGPVRADQVLPASGTVAIDVPADVATPAIYVYNPGVSTLTVSAKVLLT